MAYRYSCPHRVSALCKSGTGKPKSKKCSACGGVLRIETGRWGVFYWEEGNRYRPEDAIATYERPRAAQAKADEYAGQNVIVRWVTQ